MKRCYIVGAAPACFAAPPQPEDFLIAADGGLRALTARGWTPDLLLGDFDSLGAPPEEYPIARFPVEKDDTDSALAVQAGLERGCDTFLLEGCLGGALDHTLANLSLLTALAEQGKSAYALDGTLAVTALHCGAMDFSAQAAGRISVFSAGDEAQGVTLTGLKYPLTDAVLTRQRALGVSNCFLGQPAQIRVARGTLLIVSSWENFAFFS